MKMSKMGLLKMVATLFFLFSSYTLKAQGDTLMFYLNENYRYLDSKEGAEYIRMVIRPVKPEKLFKVRDYYKSGKLRSVGTSEKDDGSAFQGPRIVYYESGKRYEITNFKNGWLTGDFTWYYPNGLLQASGKIDNIKQKYRIDEYRDSLGNVTATNGKGAGILYYPAPLSFVDRGPIVEGLKEGEWLRFKGDTLKCKFFYTNDNITSGIGFDSLGKQYLFTSIYEGVRYKDADPLALYNFLNHKIKLTEEAKKNKVRGIITVNMVVDVDGSISDPVIINGLGYGLDEQALALIKQTNGKWLPAKQYGIPYKTEHQVMIRAGIY